MIKDDYLEKWGRNKDRNKTRQRHIPLHDPSLASLKHILFSLHGKSSNKPYFNDGTHPQNLNQKFNNSVIIKVSYKEAGRERIEQNTDSAIRYIFKDGKEFAYSSDKKKLTLDQALQEFKGKKVFKMIISVKGQEPDETYIREVMSELERQVGHKLKWMAGAHYDTNNHHTHLIISREDGAPNLSFDTPLHIPSIVFKETLRKRSVDIANRMYGFRYTEDIAAGYENDVSTLGWTSLDNRISSKVRKTNSLSSRQLENIPAWERQFIKKRLDYLSYTFPENIISNKNDGFIFMGNWQQAIRDKEKIHAIAPEEKSPVQIMRNWNITERKDVEGTIVSKRVVDEVSEKIAVLIKDKNGKLFYHEQTMTYDDFSSLREGQFVSIQWPKKSNKDQRYLQPKISKKGPVR